jgi:hypothetical protein
LPGSGQTNPRRGRRAKPREGVPSWGREISHAP